MQLLPDHNIPTNAQENGEYWSNKRSTPGRFMVELANMNRTNLDDQHAIVFLSFARSVISTSVF
jgi:hypothetical protein